MAGAVVSKPIAKKTTFFSGFARAIFKQSIGEYTTRISAPRDFRINRSSFEPGTRSMSPNEQKITSGRCAMACALSIISSDVTQTGQPGPCTSSILSGNKRSIPYLTMVCVCPPQTSINTHGLVAMRRSSSTIFVASASSRYSSRNFMRNCLLPRSTTDPLLVYRVRRVVSFLREACRCARLLPRSLC